MTIRRHYFTDQERTTLTGALRVAISVYKQDVKMLNITPGHERMAEEFNRYAANCERLLEELE